MSRFFGKDVVLVRFRSFLCVLLADLNCSINKVLAKKLIAFVVGEMFCHFFHTSFILSFAFLLQLDAGVPEKISLISRDEKSVLVVTYSDLKRCFENTFQELIAAANGQL